MTPELLACGTTNSQIEPIRRAIEAAVPVTQNPFIESQRDDDSAINPVRNKFGRRSLICETSLDNPFLNLTPDEYRTLRRYQEERRLPERFLGQTSAQDNALYQAKSPEVNPTFKTSNQEYGKYQPNIHTRPYSYHGLNTSFTAKKTKQGNFRNHSFNL